MTAVVIQQLFCVFITVRSRLCQPFHSLFLVGSDTVLAKKIYSPKPI